MVYKFEDWQVVKHKSYLVDADSLEEAKEKMDNCDFVEFDNYEENTQVRVCSIFTDEDVVSEDFDSRGELNDSDLWNEVDKRFLGEWKY